ncbi:hypothetical protein FKM82_012353 [Ascaphus truei]
MDILVMSAENGDIYLWEFDDSVMGSVPEETPALDEHQELIKKYEFLLARGPESFLETQKTSGVLNKHLAGFTCKKILAAHYKAVTALALIGKESGFHTAYLVRIQLIRSIHDEGL